MGSCTSGSKGGAGGGVQTSNNNFVDNSRYAKEHNKIIGWVKDQIGLDLNKYRDGDGSSPYTTAYWDKDGPKVAIDLKGMSHTDRQNLMNLTTKYNGRLVVEEGGAWIGYVYLRKK